MAKYELCGRKGEEKKDKIKMEIFNKFLIYLCLFKCLYLEKYKRYGKNKHILESTLNFVLDDEVF